MSNLIPAVRIEKKIYSIRGQRVILDFDLAGLYLVQTKQLKRQVKRNIKRFPQDFMFQLNDQEYKALRCQIGTFKKGQHAKYLPYAFTEQGVAMLSAVLKSKRAIDVSVLIMRVFVRLRQILASHEKLAHLFRKLENKVGQHDVEIGIIINVINKMIKHEKKPRNKIGFIANRD